MFDFFDVVYFQSWKRTRKKKEEEERKKILYNFVFYHGHDGNGPVCSVFASEEMASRVRLVRSIFSPDFLRIEIEI